MRVAGIDVGNYNGGWKKLFENSIETLKGFRRFLLITSGDTSILEGLKGKVRVLIQRCLPWMPKGDTPAWKAPVHRHSVVRNAQALFVKQEARLFQGNSDTVQCL